MSILRYAILLMDCVFSNLAGVSSGPRNMLIWPRCLLIKENTAVELGGILMELVNDELLHIMIDKRQQEKIFGPDSNLGISLCKYSFLFTKEDNYYISVIFYFDADSKMAAEKIFNKVSQLDFSQSTKIIFVLARDVFEQIFKNLFLKFVQTFD